MDLGITARSAGLTVFGILPPFARPLPARGAWRDAYTLAVCVNSYDRPFFDPFSDVRNKITVESNRRHNGKFNLAFSDGHLERIAISRLFDVADPAIRRRWCYDNDPHLP
jgi:prepilin-type processing-associated H-X9-DG protein